MREAQSLMVRHVRLLRSEIALYEYEGGEWEDLFACLQEEREPLPSNAVPLFGEASCYGRVGCLITKAILGEEQYERHRLYCGDPGTECVHQCWPPRGAHYIRHGRQTEP
jgi:hypothetical protein